MTTRREARRLALDILYQADVTSADGRAVLAEWEADDRTIPPYTRQLVDGVAAPVEELDRTIGSFAEGWAVGWRRSTGRSCVTRPTS